MPELRDEIQALETEALEALESADGDKALESVRVAYLGRKGRLTGILRGLKDVPAAERGAIGDAANRLKERLSTRLGEKQAGARRATKAAGVPGVDYSLPGLRPPTGHRHILNQIFETLSDIFTGMGFTPAHGPEVDTVFNCFDALNIEASHPSRQDTDTFFLTEDVVLRPHTSPVQIRAMMSQPAPIRIFCPGRVYRREAVDATHSCEFHQVEILYVDKNVTMRDLKGCLSTFARQMFGPETRTRFRPSYFPFVEPGAEVDVSCFLCAGRGCRVCKGSGWIEILGSGMVHPDVLRRVGYDPEEWTGYAAGLGIERIAMLRHGIPDIRLLFENDMRFLSQF